MVDVCTVVRGGGADLFDPETGQLVSVEGDLVYGPTSRGHEDRELGGACMVGTGHLQPTQTDEQVTLVYRASLPWDAPEILKRDVLVVEDSQNDPQLAGIPFIVVGVGYTTNLVARRLQLERRAFPGEVQPE